MLRAAAAHLARGALFSNARSTVTRLSNRLQESYTLFLEGYEMLISGTVAEGKQYTVD